MMISGVQIIWEYGKGLPIDSDRIQVTNPESLRQLGSLSLSCVSHCGQELDGVRVEGMVYSSVCQKGELS